MNGASMIRNMFRRVRLFKAAQELDPGAGWDSVPMKELCPIGEALNERQRAAVDQAIVNEKRTSP